MTDLADSTHPLYAKGFRAGRKRSEAETARLERAMTHAEKWNAAFLAVLPVAMTVEGWTMGNEKISSGDQRVKLAARWADRAVLQMK